ncbi:MAG: hypothetical protein CM15mV51_1070 [uncultured marine virus]|nr:MAG: hypothetical protein CM15mV51_1070 [uncultured marine virus]
MTPESVQEFSKQDPNLEKIQYFTENGPVKPIDDPKAQAIVDEINSVFNQTYEKPKENLRQKKR